MSIEQILDLIPLDPVQLVSLIVTFCSICAFGSYIAYRRKKDREQREASSNPKENIQRALEEKGLNTDVPESVREAVFHHSHPTPPAPSTRNDGEEAPKPSFVERWLKEQIDKGNIRLDLQSTTEDDPHGVKIGFLGDKYFKVTPVETERAQHANETQTQKTQVALPEEPIKKYKENKKKDKDKLLSNGKAEDKEEQKEKQQFVQSAHSDAEKKLNEMLDLDEGEEEP